MEVASILFCFLQVTYFAIYSRHLTLFRFFYLYLKLVVSNFRINNKCPTRETFLFVDISSISVCDVFMLTQVKVF